MKHERVSDETEQLIVVAVAVVLVMGMIIAGISYSHYLQALCLPI